MQRGFEYFVPRPDPRERGVDQNEAPNEAAILGCKGEADHVADIVGDQVDLFDLIVIEDGRQVTGLRLLVISTWRLGR